MFSSLSACKMMLSFILALLFICDPGFAQADAADPDPERFEEEIQRFREYDLRNSFPDNAILFTGSSSARLWKTAEAFPHLTVINRGFGGSHISDVQFFYEDVIAPYNPSLVVLYAGDNDVFGGKSPSQVLSDFQELSETILNDFPDANILYISIKPSTSRWEIWPQMNEANERVRDYTDTDQQLFYVDLATPLLGEDGKPDDSLFLEDKLHLNGDGYDAWNQVIEPVLEQIWNE